MRGKEMYERKTSDQASNHKNSKKNKQKSL